MATTKQKLLITGGGYVFYETTIHLIPKLAKEFSVYVILDGVLLSEKLIEELNVLKQKKMVQEFWQVPVFKSQFKLHQWIRSKLDLWKEKGIDVHLSFSGMEPVSQYLFEYALPKKCLKVCYASCTNYILQNESLANQLLGRSKEDNTFSSPKDDQPAEASLATKLKSKIKNIRSFSHVVALFKNGLRACSTLITTRFRPFYNRSFLPMLFIGKAFHISKEDQITQLNVSHQDVFIFCEELEQKAFKALCPQKDVQLAQYSAQGVCRCSDTNNKKTTALVTLTNIFGSVDMLPEDMLSYIESAFKIITEHTDTQSVHLRPHPLEKGKWPQHLAGYLSSKGIKAKVVDTQQPIRELMCDYAGMVGFPSSALRFARATCSNIFVVGLTGVLKDWHYINAPLWLGHPKGIGWMPDDLNYSSDMFNSDKYSPDSRPSMVDLLNRLVKKEALVASCP